MDLGGQRRSDNFEDRGQGSGGGGGGGVPIQALFWVARLLGPKGMVIVGALAAAGYFFLPAGLKAQLLGKLTGNAAVASSGGAGKVCDSSPTNASACDFSRAVLASTEDVWTAHFSHAGLPNYGPAPGAYRTPTLVVFAQGVSTGGCGQASSSSGPFYCPADQKLYIDPSFYDVLEKRLKAPGDFAQAYVIAHEVGHHVQNLIGAMKLKRKGETENQTSVRVELQADCLAGVWGHAARKQLSITEQDLEEALRAAHAIGDDTLGHSKSSDYTHGTSAQRKRWFDVGFDGGDARKCDTFAVAKYDGL
ncbi:MAG TPA: neutral zinc metallopeptidase [Polyangiaceae bacterium]|nr:neutral zinc metallopeptidase [Polyangiaceae bacterium]